MHSSIPSIIKSAVTMADVCDRYGIDVNRQGFAVCPFHNEKTASMKIYDGSRGFNCFGCGKSGDVIAFVMAYFNLDFKDALTKLSYDFGLNLPLDRRMSLREKHFFDRKEKEQNRKKAEKQQIKDRYCKALDEWTRLDRQMREYKPKTPDEELHPKFVEALIGLAEAELLLEQAESEVYKSELQV